MTNREADRTTTRCSSWRTAPAIEATICERGNGFPRAGDYVKGDDGERYRVLTVGPRIVVHLGEQTVPDCTLASADWSAAESDVFPCHAIIAKR
jgi:hypothetical protein